MQEIQPIQNEFASAKERLPKFRAKVEEKRVKATLHQNYKRIVYMFKGALLAD